LENNGDQFEPGFSIEYNEVCNESEKDVDFIWACQWAKASSNIDKNRYANILPYDVNRVVLDSPDSRNDTSYINASWISDAQTKKHVFICAQGPLENTVDDFWRMVVQYDIYVIVMLTKLFEDDKEKCSQYWPKEVNTTVTYLSITVKLLSEDEEGAITTRKFEVTDEYDSYVRNITQLQFMAWPDHGVPMDPQDYIALSDKSDEANNTKVIAKPEPNNDGKTILVHCSAGVGRSGTFCCVHSCIKNLREHVKKQNKLPDMSVAASVVSLRKERPGAVQTWEQYQFCYSTILNEFKKQEEEIKKNNLVKSHSARRPSSHRLSSKNVNEETEEIQED